MKLQRPSRLKPQFYDAHETHRMRELEGERLASFRARAIAFALDVCTILLLYLLSLWTYHGFPTQFHIKATTSSDSGWHFTGEEEYPWINHAMEIGVPILYWGLLTYITNGRTLGKWIAGIRVASTSHKRIGFWQSVERALGYSVSALEAGLGFISYFTTKNRRTSHDRLAETIVICDRDRRIIKRRPLSE